MKSRFKILLTIFTLSLGWLQAEEAPATLSPSTFSFEMLRTAFLASPIIYVSLLFLSICSVSLGIYSLFMSRKKQIVSPEELFRVKELISQNMFQEAIHYSAGKETIFFKIIKTALDHKHYGLQGMKEALFTEGKRLTASYWHRLSLINEIATIAPMIGLLGTVAGLFQGFYSLDRSLQNMMNLFDGLGISVGTTVVGLLVAIVSMLSYTLARFKLIEFSAQVESTALEVIYLIDYSAQPIEDPYVFNS